jgi:hypothetical protein
VSDGSGDGVALCYYKWQHYATQQRRTRMMQTELYHEPAIAYMRTVAQFELAKQAAVGSYERTSVFLRAPVVYMVSGSNAHSPRLIPPLPTAECALVRPIRADARCFMVVSRGDHVCFRSSADFARITADLPAAATARLRMATVWVWTLEAAWIQPTPTGIAA